VVCGSRKRFVRSGSCYTCKLEKMKASPKYLAARAAGAARKADRRRAAAERDAKRKENFAAQRAEWAITRSVRNAANGCRTRARAKGRPFTLTTDDYIRLSPLWAGVCPACGVQLTPLTHGAPSSPSLDRVHNDEGYTPANTTVICRACNTCKGIYSAAQLFRLAEYVRTAEAQSDFFSPCCTLTQTG